MHKITHIKEADETARTASRTPQEINTELLRRTSQAWVEGFRFQARVSRGMAQAFFGQWGDGFASMTRVERPTQEQSRSEVTELATNGTQKDTEVAAEAARQKAEKQMVEKAAEDTQKATDIAAATAQKSTVTAAKDAQKNTATATLPIEGYDEMNVNEVSERLDGLSGDELKRVMKYERRNKNRRSLRKEMKQKIKSTS